jgi:hypothetical protein
MRVSLVVVMLLAVAGCRGDKPKPRSDAALCSKIHRLCGTRIECFTAEDWADAAHDVGAPPVARYRACLGSADSCSDIGQCVVDLGVSAAARTSDDDDRAVRYRAVTASLTANDFGHHLAVSIDLEVATAMPNVAPHVKVEAACGDQIDQELAFFSELSNARAGARKTDTVELFRASDLGAAPARCEVTLSLSEGSTWPARYCYRAGKTSAGACP